MIKKTIKRREKFCVYHNQSTDTRSQILYMVIKVYCWVCERKEGIKNTSHTTVRNVLRDSGVEWRNSKTILAGKSRNPEYDMKKHIAEQKNNTSIDARILFEDEKKDQCS
jgi:hypothetical protein